MPNIATVFREEILRLSRKENRQQNAATKKAAAQHRRDIATLKRQVAALERQVRLLAKRTVRASGAAAVSTDTSDSVKLRFVAKGLRSHRARLALSAADFGKLVGASAQSVYAWETGKTAPRRGQVEKIAAVRALGKREATQRLAALAGTKRARGRRA